MLFNILKKKKERKTGTEFPNKKEKGKKKLYQGLDKKQHNYELLVGKYQQVLEALDALGWNVKVFLKN